MISETRRARRKAFRNPYFLQFGNWKITRIECELLSNLEFDKGAKTMFLRMPVGGGLMSRLSCSLLQPRFRASLSKVSLHSLKKHLMEDMTMTDHAYNETFFLSSDDRVPTSKI